MSSSEILSLLSERNVLGKEGWHTVSFERALIIVAFLDALTDFNHCAIDEEEDFNAVK